MVGHATDIVKHASLCADNAADARIETFRNTRRDPRLTLVLKTM
ncbi:MAG: hypothetical protein ABSH20_26790 [Tepidisphaeraceae bacterium]|jgi:hypothetical protein